MSGSEGVDEMHDRTVLHMMSRLCICSSAPIGASIAEADGVSTVGQNWRVRDAAVLTKIKYYPYYLLNGRVRDAAVLSIIRIILY